MTAIIYADGGCRSNGTENARGYGSFALDGEVRRLEFGANTTNNEAEYRALIAALSHAKEQGIQPTVLMDSALVVNQVAGKWRVREIRLRPLCDEARRLMRETGAVLNWVGRDTIVKQLGH